MSVSREASQHAKKINEQLKSVEEAETEDVDNGYRGVVEKTALSCLSFHQAP